MNPRRMTGAGGGQTQAASCRSALAVPPGRHPGHMKHQRGRRGRRRSRAKAMGVTPAELHAPQSRAAGRPGRAAPARARPGAGAWPGGGVLPGGHRAADRRRRNRDAPALPAERVRGLEAGRAMARRPGGCGCAPPPPCRCPAQRAWPLVFPQEGRGPSTSARRLQREGLLRLHSPDHRRSDHRVPQGDQSRKTCPRLSCHTRRDYLVSLMRTQNGRRSNVREQVTSIMRNGIHPPAASSQ